MINCWNSHASWGNIINVMTLYLVLTNFWFIMIGGFLILHGRSWIVFVGGGLQCIEAEG